MKNLRTILRATVGMLAVIPNRPVLAGSDDGGWWPYWGMGR